MAIQAYCIISQRLIECHLATILFLLCGRKQILILVLIAVVSFFGNSYKTHRRLACALVVAVRDSFARYRNDAQAILPPTTPHGQPPNSHQAPGSWRSNHVPSEGSKTATMSSDEGSDDEDYAYSIPSHSMERRYPVHDACEFDDLDVLKVRSTMIS